MDEKLNKIFDITYSGKPQARVKLKDSREIICIADCFTWEEDDTRSLRVICRDGSSEILVDDDIEGVAVYQ